MKLTLVFLILLLVSCKNNNPNPPESANPSYPTGSIQSENSMEQKEEAVNTFSNEHFRKVKVEKVNDHQFKVQGEARVFEANFNWVVKDENKELKSGSVMTNRGAPAWGKFDFTIEIEEKDNYSTLTLVLYEISAKDGSRDNELSITLS